MMMKCKVIFLSNFLDEATRVSRKIDTDSPACSRKILMMAKALLSYDKHLPLILSMGRGRQSNTQTIFYRYLTKAVDGIQVIYAPFYSSGLLSYLVSVLSLSYLLFKIRFQYPATSFKLIAWNRTNAYLFPLLVAKLLFFQIYLDLEDSDYLLKHQELRNILLIIRSHLYTFLCNSGILLSTKYLFDPFYPQKQIVYYGYLDRTTSLISDEVISSPSQYSSIQFLFCGTLTEQAGADTLLNCLHLMKVYQSCFDAPLVFHICGSGPYLPLFREFSSNEAFPYVVVHDRLTNRDFSGLLKTIDISLALKKVSGYLSTTTFPSKVLELSGEAHFIITTDVSDVKEVIGELSAAYLPDDSPYTLLTTIIECVQNIRSIRENVFRNTSILRDSYSIESARALLLSFFDIP